MQEGGLLVPQAIPEATGRGELDDGHDVGGIVAEALADASGEEGHQPSQHRPDDRKQQDVIATHAITSTKMGRIPYRNQSTPAAICPKKRIAGPAYRPYRMAAAARTNIGMVIRAFGSSTPWLAVLKSKPLPGMVAMPRMEKM